MLDNSSLAVARLMLRVVESAITSIVLGGVHIVATEVHVLHAHGQERRHAVMSRTRGGRARRTSRTRIARGDVAVGIEVAVGVVGSGSRSNVGSLVALRGVGEAWTRSTRAERSGIGLKSRLNGGEMTGLLTGTAHVVVAGQLAAVTTWNSAGRNATNAGVVVVKVLLGVVVGHRSVVGALDGRDVVGREGALQLGRGGHHVVGRRDNGVLVVGRSVRVELEVERVTGVGSVAYFAR